MSVTEKEKKRIEEEEAYRAQIREQHESGKAFSAQSQTPSKSSGGRGTGCLIVIVGIFIFVAIILIAINPAKQFESAEKPVVGKHAYNKITGAYRGKILQVKNCENKPELMCYVVNQQSYMRPMEAPVDNSEVRDEAPSE